MDSTATMVLIGGVIMIITVIWYFFGERETVVATVASSGIQDIKITVKGGYTPDVVVVREGIPVKLSFYRDENSSCSDKVIFRDFSIAQDLPAFKTTLVEFTPDKAGEFNWTCGMNMMRGKLIVKANEDPSHSKAV